MASTCGPMLYQQDAGWTFFEITFWKYFTQWWEMRPHFISTVLTSTKHYLLCYWSNSEILWGLVSLCAHNGIILCLNYFILYFQNTFPTFSVTQRPALHSKSKNTLRVWAPHFQILDSTFSRLDYTFWLDSTLKICPGPPGTFEWRQTHSGCGVLVEGQRAPFPLAGVEELGSAVSSPARPRSRVISLSWRY